MICLLAGYTCTINTYIDSSTTERQHPVTSIGPTAAGVLGGLKPSRCACKTLFLRLALLLLFLLLLLYCYDSPGSFMPNHQKSRTRHRGTKLKIFRFLRIISIAVCYVCGKMYSKGGSIAPCKYPKASRQDDYSARACVDLCGSVDCCRAEQ